MTTTPDTNHYSKSEAIADGAAEGDVYCPVCGFSEFAKLEIDGGLDCLNCGAWVHLTPGAWIDENKPVPPSVANGEPK